MASCTSASGCCAARRNTACSSRSLRCRTAGAALRSRVLDRVMDRFYEALEQGDEDARQRLVEHHRLSAGKLNAEKVKYVSARAQFREEQLLEPLFTEDELAVFKRGRNASKASVAKHASPEEYRASTGFECLLGWLYLNGQLDRVHELFDTLWQQFDPNETR